MPLPQEKDQNRRLEDHLSSLDRLLGDPVDLGPYGWWEGVILGVIVALGLLLAMVGAMGLVKFLLGILVG